MDVKFFESLLYEDESETLDFKRDQYPFSQASDEQKSELLKDIVGFGNAWRRADAYLLVGVEHVRGGRSTVVGVSEHLPDHSLQQFVAGAIDRSLQFAYEAFTYEGKNVGVIRIARQRRPFQLTRSLGKLQKGCVYVRRGSSTDSTKPATVDEIAEMKAQDLSIIDQATLSVEFAHVDRDEPRGTSLHGKPNSARCRTLGRSPILSMHRTRVAPSASSSTTRFAAPTKATTASSRISPRCARSCVLSASSCRTSVPPRQRTCGSSYAFRSLPACSF